jgi:hypothetical protein
MAVFRAYKYPIAYITRQKRLICEFGIIKNDFRELKLVVHADR